MSTQMQVEISDGPAPASTHLPWRTLYRIGGFATMGTVLVGLGEIGITFLPGGNASASTVVDWFTLFHSNWFMGLRNLGLLNILFNALDIPIMFALFGAHRKTSPTLAGLAVITSFIGVAVFYATNRAFAMLDLSNQYALATSDGQRTVFVAAGQALLSVGQSHTPGTFIAFFLSEFASLMISYVMLQSKVFSKSNALVGLVGFSFLLIFEISTSFVPALHPIAMLFAMLGGILSLVWGILVAVNLFHLAEITKE